MGAIVEGTGLSREALAHRWAQIIADPKLSDLPYTIELDDCIEVVSPSNPIGKLQQKMAAYLAAGAIEAWMVLEHLSIRVFSPDGEQKESRFTFDLAAWRRGLA